MSIRLKHRGLVFIILLAVGAVPVKLTLDWMNRPSAVIIHTPTTAAAKPQSLPPLDMQSSLFVAKAPGGFSLRTASAEPTSSIPVHLLAINSSTDQQLALIGGVLTPEGIQAVADYNLRITEAASYQPVHNAGLPNGAVGFAAIGGSPSYTVFWTHGSHYAEISTSAGAASQKDLENTLLFTLHNWQWR